MPKTPKTLHHTPPTHHHKATTSPTTLKTHHHKSTTCPNTLKTHHHKTTKTHHNKTTTIPTTLKTHHHKSTTIITTLDCHNHKTTKTGNHEPTQKMPTKTASMPTRPLEPHAQRYPDSRIGDYNLVHSSGPYGKNIATSSRDLSAMAAVNMFVSKKSSYHYNSNSCAPGKVCGHYTQVVWRNSVRLGCAKARYNNGSTFIGCNYDPPGNYNGKRPY
ncbi:hypothetical protein PRUPE_8G071800 [Prunus persica]|uniref:SCP domain-containing protein n=1 Tax=Prunus persica TaxID=3760 RepID=A0A251MUG3_PRUPE|nr:hypothetical protein PRUPE_8G071800 [Prunus persica]